MEIVFVRGLERFREIRKIEDLMKFKKRVSMGLSVWRETSKKLTVCREKGKKLTVCRDYFCSDNCVVCRGSQWG